MVLRRRASSRAKRANRERTRALCIPSTCSAASNSLKLGSETLIASNRISQACLELLQTAPYPGFHRPERLLKMSGQFGVREAVKKSKHDALPLARLQCFETTREIGSIRRR